MKSRLKSINNIPFLVCLIILLLNDFYFKTNYHNWLTGKLSDFCGLFIFSSFWAAIFPNKKRTIYILIALFFVIWKSPYSQIFIDFFSQRLYPIHRVVDISDLIALIILPISFYFKPENSFRLKLNPIPFTVLSIFSFCATSIPEPTQIFEQPQYLLFKSGLASFENNGYPSKYDVYYLDSLVVIGIKEIRIDKPATIDDEFHKVQILKNIELRFLRESKERYEIGGSLNDYEELRDSLTLNGMTSIILKFDSISDHLNFKNTRLDGNFERFSNGNNLMIKGKYKDGIEDSIWSFYNSQNEIKSKKFFKNGELTRTESFENAILKSEVELNTRENTIRDKHFHIALLGILIIVITIGLFYNFKKLKNKNQKRLYHLTKVGWSLLLPFPTLILVKFISSYIPNAHPVSLFGILGEVILAFIILVPVYLIIFYVLKLRSWLDLIYYILLLSLSMVFIEEIIYIKNMS